MNSKTYGHTMARLALAGVTFEDAQKLYRISQKLDRWNELASGADPRGNIQTDGETGKTFWYSHLDFSMREYPDKKGSALTRLKNIMARYPNLGYQVEGDPRRPALMVFHESGDIAVS